MIKAHISPQAEENLVRKFGVSCLVRFSRYFDYQRLDISEKGTGLDLHCPGVRIFLQLLVSGLAALCIQLADTAPSGRVQRMATWETAKVRFRLKFF
ncbi:hypothetical protein DTO271D3_7112 [Paecilomyces variotii]|nr:hypothetical protein DTO207G8_3082 [Paecilomyces variotii]KAJ9312565.1 hypothetical protein DTO271D3_7112 [Paecilomyces variotii]